MKASRTIQRKACLTGLLLAFLLSAVVMPAFSAEPSFDLEKKIHFSETQDTQTTPSLPLQLPEEEKEEESRSDKNHTADYALSGIEFELKSRLNRGPTSWEFNHTNASALTNFPIYLSKQSLLI